MANDYWRELEKEEKQKRVRREELERPLLEGTWITAADALMFLQASADVIDPKEFILKAAAREHNKHPMLRAKAETAKESPTDVMEPVRRNRIVHPYEWDGIVEFAAWPSGFFELKSRHFSARRIVTLTGVQFSLCDLEAIVGVARIDPAANAPSKPRRKMFDHEAFIKEAADVLADEGGFSPDFTQADLYAKMETWCLSRWPRSPSRTWMYDRWSEAESVYKDSLS